jgi:PPK2 family polyphosphate:nucleotide phosphotransferase
MSKFDDLIIRPGKRVDLGDYQTDSAKGVPEMEEAEARTEKWALRIGELQDRLFSEGRRAVLMILQGMDASGKDGTVRRVLDHVNPTGVHVTSFKTPTPLERRHDFLWRCHDKVPPRGDIAVFNRSYYEEVLIVRVHADALLPSNLRDDKNVWKERYRLINDFEDLLETNGTRVLKFMLHISKAEQKRRFMARQQDPEKHWKLAAGDFAERQFWGDYLRAYEKAMEATSTEDSPWYVIPSDRKWVRNYHIAHVLWKTLEDMDPRPPAATDKRLVTMKFA